MSAVTLQRRPQFDVNTFLSTIGRGRRIAAVLEHHFIFAQGDPSDSAFYIQKGKVRLTVLATSGKTATIGILEDGDFFGEGCLVRQPVRLYSAIAMTDCCVVRIERAAMTEILHREHTFANIFTAFLLRRNVRCEEDLVDQLFNSSEKRLARILLLLAQIGKDGKPEAVISNISQETLAEMVGTTRSRVNFFMNKFRNSGFIRYEREIEVHSSLLNVLLYD
jgi:CRP/FNR family cyclic AMP-dependent transcriptional regulator